MNKQKGQIIVMSGPSGTGKSTVLKELLALRDDIGFSVSATTRSPRTGEVHGRDYFFLSREEFQAMIARDEFLEHAEYVGNYYGTPIAPILEAVDQGKNILLDIEVQGAAQVIRKLPEAVTIFLAPPGLDELEARLRGRGTDTEEAIAGRLRQAETECTHIPEYRYLVVNEVPAQAAREISAIIDASACASEEKKQNLMSLLRRV